MPNRFVPAAAVDVNVAALILRPEVDRITDRLRDEVRRRAPDVKVWITARDERVRPSHVATDGQSVPANVPFLVQSVTGTGHDLADKPRDPNLPEGNRINCRCQATAAPEDLRETIRATPTTVAGPRVSASVETRYLRADESEYAEQGGRWMRDALEAERRRYPRRT